MKSKNPRHHKTDQNEAAAHETVVQDLKRMMAMWSSDQLPTGAVINAMLLVAHAQTFARIQNPDTAVQVIMDSLNNVIEINVEDEEFQAKHQRLSLQDDQLH
jgi:hypothetical protein